MKYSHSIELSGLQSSLQEEQQRRVAMEGNLQQLRQLSQGASHELTIDMEEEGEQGSNGVGGAGEWVGWVVVARVGEAGES